MAMTPENYVGLKKRCDELCNECSEIISSFKENNEEIEKAAESAYEELIRIERELEKALINIKTPSIREEYNIRLAEIRSYKSGIHTIAHIV